jgi:hypothetical protein
VSLGRQAGAATARPSGRKGIPPSRARKGRNFLWIWYEIHFRPFINPLFFNFFYFRTNFVPNKKNFSDLIRRKKRVIPSRGASNEGWDFSVSKENGVLLFSYHFRTIKK